MYIGSQVIISTCIVKYLQIHTYLIYVLEELAQVRSTASRPHSNTNLPQPISASHGIHTLVPTGLTIYSSSGFSTHTALSD